MRITPQEKAKELINKLTIDIRPFSEHGHWDEYQGKQCALIAVDEIILECVHSGNFIAKPYWVNVKQEIERL